MMGMILFVQPRTCMGARYVVCYMLHDLLCKENAHFGGKICENFITAPVAVLTLKNVPKSIQKCATNL